MDKKILVAIDESSQSTDTIQYAARMADAIAPATFTLLHVQSALSQYLTDEAQRKPSARQALEKVMAENEKNARSLLEKIAQRMVREGVEANRIEQFTIPRNTGVADDILALGKAKSYDAVLVGRRGASYLRQWLVGSVTANLIEHSDLIPIWMVDGDVTTSKVLLAADGSQSTLRALDHMAFMLSGLPEQTIELLHIRPRLQDYCEISLEEETVQDAESILQDEDQHCMDDFYSRALTVLENNNVARDRLNMTSLDGKLSVPRRILQYAGENGFGTVVLGRRGRSKSSFFGSVSRGLLQKAEDMALWVVP